MIKLFSIGFTQKTSEQFFNLLKVNGVQKLIDIRAHGNSQLSGFAQTKNLGYFCKVILGIAFEKISDFAPSETLMQNWRARKIPYDEYRKRYIAELDQRNVLSLYEPKTFDGVCFLCSEASPAPCHRKILCEYLKEHCNDEVVISHLV